MSMFRFASIAALVFIALSNPILRLNCDTSSSSNGTSYLPRPPPAVSSEQERHEIAKAAMRRSSKYKYEAPEPRTPQSLEKAQELCGEAPYDAYFKQPSINKKHQRSANNEDLNIYQHFIKPFEDSLTHPPTYVELGAFNGLEESNSRFFDTCLGWEGLLVEANPHEKVFPQLVVNRPHAHRFHMAASCDNDGSKNTTMGFYASMWTNSAEEGTRNAYTGSRESVAVPCGSLTHLLLDLFPNGHVTFFSLDVEGAEPRVLEQLDLQKVHVEMLMVESFNNFCAAEPGDCQSRNEFRKIAKDSGYILFKGVINKSDLFIRPDSQFLQAERLKGLQQY